MINECDGKYELINYLQFVVCDLGEQLQVRWTVYAFSDYSFNKLYIFSLDVL